MIEVKETGDGTFEVTVRADRETLHRVTLGEEYFRKLAREEETREQVIERAFEFLLRNEPNTSILSSFDLTVIPRYFPDFEEEMRRES